MQQSALRRVKGIRLVLECAVGAIGVLLAVILMLGIGWETGHFKNVLVHFLEMRAGRPIIVKGAFRAHLFSRQPSLVAEQVEIGNPPWMPHGTMAEIGKLTLIAYLPGFNHAFAIRRLELEATNLHLHRDEFERANWQWRDPHTGLGNGPPIIFSLSMLDAKVDLLDARRQLQFHGTVSAREVDGSAGLRPLRITGEGQLNERHSTFTLDGAPLASTNGATPYQFSFTEHSSGSTLSGNGAVLQPFNFTLVDVAFNAVGADLRDLYFLTGMTLVNTGSYRLSGKLARRGTHFFFNDLLLDTGESDVHGNVSIETSSGRPAFNAEFRSTFLRLADFGARAAGREPADVAGTPLLLSAAAFHPETVRRDDGVAHFQAQKVQIGRVPLDSVAISIRVDQGIVSVSSLSAGILGGKLMAHAQVNANKNQPTADFEVAIANMQMGKLFHAKGTPPVEGLLNVKLSGNGHGTSVHQIAAGANGTLAVTLTTGSMRASLAELAGLDLRGLGLALTEHATDTAIRCGASRFSIRDGTLNTQNGTLDTSPVLITATGEIHLKDESLDLIVQGHPKGLRFMRLRRPLVVRGTLSQPSIELKEGKAAFSLIDYGKAKDVDCHALLGA